MSPEIRTLFSELTGVSRAERESYYIAHSVSSEIREDLESLFAFDNGGTAIGDIVNTAVGLVFPESVSAGDYCGPFKTVRLIGRGGMGLVYLAERIDGEVRQQVAVKVLQGSLDSAAARQRFLQERQILANLAHPNIARLIDAGHRADGHPYLVMEYIEGRSIDEHSRTLSAREKVSLMVTVCEAIASAHQKLVVHRDIKPGNILVDGNGNPRVLDFGIAKLMDPSDTTVTIERRLTPEYASPEQRAGEAVTTATDIYSLGAVLHKLLMNSRKTDSVAAGVEVEFVNGGEPRPAFALLAGEALSREPASPPSKIQASGDGDLDAIVRKATRKEPDERYTTADNLAEDLRAWLEHRPVGARQGERWYRARRQLRRHWALAAAAVIAAAGLITGLVTARAERDVAQRRFDEVRELANEFFAIEKEVQNLPGSTAVRERIVKTSIKYLEGLSKQAGDDWRLKAEIASGYRKAAEAQGVFRGINLGRSADAQRSLDQAASLLNEVRAAAPEDRIVLRDLIELAELQSRIAYGSKNFSLLEAKLTELRGLLTRYESDAKDELAEWQFLGRVYESMAVSARDLGRLQLPMELARRSVELRRKAAGKDKSPTALGNLATSLSAYAGLLRATGDLSGAVENFQQSLAVLERMAAASPNQYKTQLNIANTYAAIGRNLGDAGGPSLRRTDAALKHFQESMRISGQLMPLDVNDQLIRFNHSLTAWRLGDAIRGRDPRRALAAYDEAIEILRPMPAKQFSRDMPLVAALAESTFALRALGREAETESRLKEANAIAEWYRDASTPVYDACREIISRAEAGLALARGRPLDAVAAHREWLKSAEDEKSSREVKEDINSAYQVSVRYRLLRDALLAAGMKAEAEETDRKRRAIVDFWKRKLPAPNDAELILLR
ncbi:MAG: protein kinase domain-containing protein [Bryobacteraceae bacterium]